MEENLWQRGVDGQCDCSSGPEAVTEWDWEEESRAETPFGDDLTSQLYFAVPFVFVLPVLPEELLPC